MPTIAQVKQHLDRIWYASFQTGLTDTLAAELRRQALLGVKAALETALVEELEAHRQHVQNQQHPTELHRSGTYTRRLLTTHGFIPDLHIPKLRAGNRDTGGRNDPWGAGSDMCRFPHITHAARWAVCNAPQQTTDIP